MQFFLTVYSPENPEKRMHHGLPFHQKGISVHFCPQDIICIKLHENELLKYFVMHIKLTTNLKHIIKNINNT